MSTDFLRKLNNAAKAVERLPNKLAMEAKRFSTERFQQHNWIGDTTEPWRARKPKKESKKRAQRGILTDSSRLRTSVRKIYVGSDKIILGTDVPYAEAHNSGGRFRSTQNVKAHTRNEFRRKGSIVKAHSVKGFTRTMNINMPKRQFIGDSPYLNRRLQRMIIAEWNKVLK
ncbi:MAG: phage virion morphogenesis protein [Crocinitomicaceae bacterium]|nr:phage virion morphogenesis protein [Crocinitomicaceae bacterium]